MTEIEKDRGTSALKELKDFLGFIQGLWGVLTGISVLFPLSNEIFRVIPIKPFDDDGVFVFFSPHLITTLTTLISLYIVFATYNKRKTIGRENRSAGRSFIGGILCLLGYLIGYAVFLNAWQLVGIQSDSVKRLFFEVPLICLYSCFFAFMTRAFLILGIHAYYKSEEEMHKI